MSTLRNHPVFAALMLALVVLIGAGVWLDLRGRSREAALAEQLRQRIDEVDRFQRQRPAPNDVNLRGARADLADNAGTLATMLRALNVVGADELEYFKGEPASRTDAYFDIAQFVDRMRTGAGEAGVKLAADERFGFSLYTNEGPEPGLIQPVYRQRRIVEYLLRALFDARPRALLSVQREEPLRVDGAAPDGAPAPRSAPNSGASTGATGDLFTIDPQVSARTPGYVDTIAFRIAFSGQTAALRGFMNALAAPEIPLVVRSVEVDSAPTAGPRPGDRENAPPPTVFGIPVAPPDRVAEGAIPIVAENDSRFTVTLEMFEVKIRPPEVGLAAK